VCIGVPHARRSTTLLPPLLLLSAPQSPPPLTNHARKEIITAEKSSRLTQRIVILSLASLRLLQEARDAHAPPSRSGAAALAALLGAHYLTERATHYCTRTCLTAMPVCGCQKSGGRAHNTLASGCRGSLAISMRFSERREGDAMC
jgi:hypothetical protein